MRLVKPGLGPAEHRAAPGMEKAAEACISRTFYANVPELPDAVQELEAMTGGCAAPGKTRVVWPGRGPSCEEQKFGA